MAETATPLALSLAGAAKALDLSERTIRRRIEDGTIRAARVGGRVLIPLRELERVLGIAQPATPTEAA